MKQEEINVLVSITNDAASLARKINSLTWEFNRVRTESPSTRTPQESYDFGLMCDAMRRSGEELTSAIDIADRVIARAKRAQTEES